MSKQCTRCKETKSLTEFFRHTTTKGGYGVWCKSCHRAYNRQRYASLKKEKICTACKAPLNGTSNTICINCAEKQRIYTRNYKARTNYKPIPSHSYEKRKSKKAHLIKLLGDACFKCGYIGIALVFHHVTNEKDSKDWRRSKEMERFIQEGKIMLLCANCHRELHHAFRYWWEMF